MEKLRQLLEGLCDYSRCLLLWSIFLAVVCLFLAALTGYIAPQGNYMRLCSLAQGLGEASYATLAAVLAAVILCELIWRHDLS